MSAYDHLPYRPCVGIMLLNAQGRVFVGQRIDMRTEAWQMPQGGIDLGEDPRQTAFREMKEEIGTDKGEIIAETQGWLDYDLPDELVPRVWGGKYRGQTQKWFLMRFTGVDADINIETDEPEFHQWRWVSPKEVPDLIVPFKQALYQQLLAEFTPYIER